MKSCNCDLHEGGLSDRVHVSTRGIHTAGDGLRQLPHNAAQRFVSLGILLLKQLASIKQQCACTADWWWYTLWTLTQG